MEPVILLIRQSDRPGIIDSFIDEDAACAALAAYVRRQLPRGRASNPPDDEEAVTAWFDDQRAHYAIGRVSVPSPVGLNS